MISRFFAIVMIFGLLTALPGQADPGTRVRARSVSEVTAVASTRSLPSSLLVPASRKSARSTSPPQARTEIAPGITVPVPVGVHQFGLGREHPLPVSQRQAFRVGCTANQATWALGFLPHQPELRPSLVELFEQLAEETSEVEASRGFRELASVASSGEAPAVILTRHRELMESLAAELERLGGDRRWYFDLGYSTQQLHMVVFFQRRGMVGQGLAAVRVLAAEVPAQQLDPGLRRRLEDVTSQPAPRDSRGDLQVKGSVDQLLAWF